MAFEVVLPRLGWNMEVGSLASWHKQDGDPVEVGEILLEVEGDKAVQEIEALESGILRIPPDSPSVGQQVPVGTVLAYLIQPGEAVPFSGQKPAAVMPGPASAPTPSDPAKTSNPARKRYPPISPRALRVARELGVDWAKPEGTLKGSGSTGRIVERDVRRVAAAAAVTPPVEVRASPVARRAAQSLGVDLAQLAAQQPGRRIDRVDVEAAAQKAVPAAATVAPLPPGSEQRLPISPVRRVTAERMAASAHTTAPVTLTTEADATELVRLRQQLKEDGSQIVPSYNDLLVKLAAQALREHPQLNARFEGEAIVQSAAVNIGVAVDTERGLLVPVVRDVQAKSLRQVAEEAAALIEQARNGHARPDDLHGGTFTITNLGIYEIDAFTPIINLPECAVLGVGRIIAKQVVVDADAERVAIRRMMFISLTFDHRLVDGAPAARFLQRVKQYIEKPYLWLTR
jgi:pyruvate dehydrogenase E2 component (dihydrolipoamide acetyltransferase)